MTAKLPRRSTFRRAAAALGALSAVPLAGCSEQTAGSGTSTGGTPGRMPVAGAGGDTTAITCDDAGTPPFADEERVPDEYLEDEFRRMELRTSARATEYLVELVESGFPDTTLERGREVGLAAREAVVTLQIMDGGLPGNHATAWFVEEGYLFTNAHNVLSGGTVGELRGVTHDGTRFDVEVVDFVEGMTPDVALLRTAYRGPTPLPMGKVDGLEAGQPLVQVGHPGEIGYWIVSMGRFVEARSVFTLDEREYTALTSVVPGREGVSGSPVLTLDGEVVGMTYGGEPITARDPGDPAPVAPDIVFDGPIGAIVTSAHDGSDVLEMKLEEWR